MGQEDFGEVNLNPGNDQRLIMVAAQFRKEVTSTVLWLLKHGVSVQCFKATPFQLGDQFLLNLEQVIPLPEAEELMIGIRKASFQRMPRRFCESGGSAVNMSPRELHLAFDLLRSTV